MKNMTFLNKQPGSKADKGPASKQAFVKGFLTAAAVLVLSLFMLTGCFDGSISEGASSPVSSDSFSSSAETAGVPDAESSSDSFSPSEETSDIQEAESSVAEEASDTISEDGTYTSKEDVALYLHVYGHLPGNFITKKEAEELGWNSKEGNLWDVAPGKSIGGSRFGNYEGNLPDKEGRTYYECDINYEGGYRGSERLIYSNDGLIFYTSDHYQTFEQLY